MNTFRYKITETNEAGEKNLISTGVVFVREVSNSILKDDKLYLFLKQEQESVQLVKAPQKVKITKENPIGWIEGIEKRTVKEPVAIQISEPDDIARWESYTKSIDIA